MSAEFSITRSTVIDAPLDDVFAHVDDFHAWPAWSPWEGTDPSLKRDYSGPERGVGSRYAWAGNRKAGAGSMEIVTVVPGELIRIDLKFTKPFKARNEVLFAFRPTDDDAESTEVTWTMNGRKLLPMRVLSRVGLVDMDKMLGPDFEKGLAALKRECETR